MEWNEPSPERVSGIQKSRPDGHVRLLKMRGQDYISTNTMIGYFPTNMIPKRIFEVRQRGIIQPLNAPVKCRRCGDYMKLKKGGGYTCV